MMGQRSSERAFLGGSALLFAASATATIVWCRAMASMGGDMLMPGGWTMSMVWMRMPDQTWAGAAASFLGMWAVMMVAMMLPALVPALCAYRRAVPPAGEARRDLLTALAGSGYFAVWTATGFAAYPIGIAVATVEMEHAGLSRAVPMAAAVLVLLAGVLQLTGWKARQLTCCRMAPRSADMLPVGPATAWRHGVRLGVRCLRCCFGLMALLVILGVMDLRLMLLVTAAITAERLLPQGERVARAVGWVVVVVGVVMAVRSAGLA